MTKEKIVVKSKNESVRETLFSLEAFQPKLFQSHVAWFSFHPYAKTIKCYNSIDLFSATDKCIGSLFQGNDLGHKGY